MTPYALFPEESRGITDIFGANTGRLQPLAYIVVTEEARDIIKENSSAVLRWGCNQNDGEMMLTPEDDPMPDDPKPPWEPNVSRPWSLLASPHRASAPFKESMDGVGDVISPDFCLT